jgi:hypothetical protein
MPGQIKPRLYFKQQKLQLKAANCALEKASVKLFSAAKQRRGSELIQNISIDEAAHVSSSLGSFSSSQRHYKAIEATFVCSLSLSRQVPL